MTSAGLILAAALLLSGCGGDNGGTATLAEEGTSTNRANISLVDLPDSAPGLLEALRNAQSDEEILFTGRVGGMTEPITPGFAAFVVADEGIVFCDEMGDDDHCSMPWDACCEDPEKLAASRALVQFVDAAGDPFPGNLTESIGLEPNDTVVVRGRLSPQSVPGNPIILAGSIEIR